MTTFAKYFSRRSVISHYHGFFRPDAYSHSEQSSPGNLQVGQVPSNWTRQMPQTSSSGMSQCQVATAFHSFKVTFIALVFAVEMRKEERCGAVR